MTETQWAASDDPHAMLDFLFPMHGLESIPDQPRSLRLYHCALARRVWDELPGPMRVGVEEAERFADAGILSWKSLAPVYHVAERMIAFRGESDHLAHWANELHKIGLNAPHHQPMPNGVDRWKSLNLLSFLPLWQRIPEYRWIPAEFHHTGLLRDLFQPFPDPHPFDSAWRTATVRNLACTIYRDHGFDRMPYLADALAEAGCDSPGMLDHCRNPKHIHARGCWLLDRVLATP
jgi:hypothetical protein